MEKTSLDSLVQGGYGVQGTSVVILATISGIFWCFLGNVLPVLVFCQCYALMRQHASSSNKKESPNLADPLKKHRSKRPLLCPFKSVPKCVPSCPPRKAPLLAHPPYLPLVARFARIGNSHDSRESGDSRESELRGIRANRPVTRYKNRGFNCE